MANKLTLLEDLITILSTDLLLCYLNADVWCIALFCVGKINGLSWRRVSFIMSKSQTICCYSLQSWERWKPGDELFWEYWGLFDRASPSLNKAKCQLDATRYFYWCILSSTCFGYIRPSSGALEFELQLMVFCTEFLDVWWSREPLRRSCVRCGWCCATRTVHTI